MVTRRQAATTFCTRVSCRPCPKLSFPITVGSNMTLFVFIRQATRKASSVLQNQDLHVPSQDNRLGNWRLLFGDSDARIGYWPRELFTEMADLGTTQAVWGR